MYTKANTTLKETSSLKAKTKKSLKKGTSVRVYTSQQSKDHYRASSSKDYGWIAKSQVTASKTITTKQNENIPFKTITKNDNTLAKGTSKVSVNGKNGVRVVTYQKVYNNGKVTGTKRISSTVTGKAVDKIVLVGTKVITQKPVVKPKPVVSKPKPVVQPTKAKYLTSDQARSVLKKSSLMDLGNNAFSLNNKSGMLIYLEVNKNHVNHINFDGTEYRGNKKVKLETTTKNLGKEKGQILFDEVQKDIKGTELAFKSACDSVYGIGTKESKDLYDKMIKEGVRNNSSTVIFE